MSWTDSVAVKIVRLRVSLGHTCNLEGSFSYKPKYIQCFYTYSYNILEIYNFGIKNYNIVRHYTFINNFTHIVMKFSLLLNLKVSVFYLY